MLKCPKCGKEIRYIVGAPSSGNSGQPIAVDVEYSEVIHDSGSIVKGHVRHRCKEEADQDGNC